MDNPTNGELIGFDRTWKGKTTSNTEWESSTDGASPRGRSGLGAGVSGGDSLGGHGRHGDPDR